MKKTIFTRTAYLLTALCIIVGSVMMFMPKTVLKVSAESNGSSGY